jgi:manganese efflux pump family protein
VLTVATPSIGARLRHRATKLLVTGVVLAAAGCSAQPAATRTSVTSCFQFAARAIQRHVTVTAVPAACQGLSQLEVNVAVSRALRAAASGVHGKVRQRQVIARDSPYVADLIRAVPASSPPAVTAPQSSLPGQPAVTAPQSPLPGQPAASSSRAPSRAAFGLAALIAWLVTVGLGVSMMARWITQARRHGPQPRGGRGPVLNFAHFGLALTGLLVWISYLATGVSGLAWAACGLLLAVASLGMALVFLGPATAAEATRPGDGSPPAAQPPVLVIAAHITAACVTILLATLAAIGSG